MKDIDKLKEILLSLYREEGPERVGFIHGDSKIVEVKNFSDKPMDGFKVGAKDLIDHTDQEDCWATWHTHPKDVSNLSGEDYHSFKSWPDLHHFIIGNDGVKVYKWSYEKDALLEV